MILQNLKVKTFRTKNKDEENVKGPKGTNHGFQDGTYEYIPQQYENYGIVCGEVKDAKDNKKYLLVIDVDNKNNGMANWNVISLRFRDEDLDTYTVKTQSGGLHYYYTVDLPFKTKQQLANNIDIKFVGGYVVGAGSVGEKGNYTVINNTDILPLPEEMFLFMESQFENNKHKEDVEFESVELDVDKQEAIINGLMENREWDRNYNDRLSILIAMKKTGFDLSDFTDAVIIGSSTGKSKQDWRASWNSIPDGEATENDYKTLIKYSKVFIDCFEDYKVETDGSNELIYLATLVTNKKILKQFVDKPKNLIYQFFSSRVYKELALFAIEYYQENNTTVLSKSLKYEFIKTKEHSKKFPINLYIAAIDKIFEFDLTSVDEDIVLKDMVERLNYLFRVSKTKELDKDHSLSNEDKLKEMANLRPFTVTEKKLGLSLGDFATLKSIMDTKVDKIIPSGYVDYDDIFGGGFKAKEMTVFGGVSGSGKTLVMGNFAVNALLANKNVVYFTLEVSQDIIATRLISNIVNMPMKNLLLNFDTVQKTYENLLANNLCNLKIIEGNSREFSPFDVRRTLDDLKEEEGFEADIIFVDYIGIMGSDVQKANMDNTNQFQKAIAEDLRNIAKDYNIPVVSAVQLNREAMAKEGGSISDADIRTMADSIGVGHTADNIVMIIQTKEQKAKNTMYLKVSKNRNGINGVEFAGRINYDCVKITSLGKVK